MRKYRVCVRWSDGHKDILILRARDASAITRLVEAMAENHVEANPKIEWMEVII